MFPVHDWQFWVASAVALAAAYTVARMLLPASWLPARRKPGRRVTLTIEGTPTPTASTGAYPHAQVPGRPGQHPASKAPKNAS
ncbi:MAG: hypothetical protein HRU70_06115 [Phycisphaeraceae bacterium]|nr:MAG: hypothetical protein HRU70_06115 [Phycisphaeraceae bacterium]